MKKHIAVPIPEAYSEESAAEFVRYMLERRRKLANPSAKKRLDAVVALVHGKGGISDADNKKYEDEKDLR